jgi:hypothetical protein
VGRIFEDKAEVEEESDESFKSAISNHNTTFDEDAESTSLNQRVSTRNAIMLGDSPPVKAAEAEMVSSPAQPEEPKRYVFMEAPPESQSPGVTQGGQKPASTVPSKRRISRTEASPTFNSDDATTSAETKLTYEISPAKRHQVSRKNGQNSDEIMYDDFVAATHSAQDQDVQDPENDDLHFENPPSAHFDSHARPDYHLRGPELSPDLPSKEINECMDEEEDIIVDLPTASNPTASVVKKPIPRTNTRSIRSTRPSSILSSENDSSADLLNAIASNSHRPPSNSHHQAPISDDSPNSDFSSEPSAAASTFSPAKADYNHVPGWRHTRTQYPRKAHLRPASKPVGSIPSKTHVTSTRNYNPSRNNDEAIPATNSDNEQTRSNSFNPAQANISSLKQKYREACADWERRNGTLRTELAATKADAEFWRRKYKFELNDLVAKKVAKGVEKARAEFACGKDTANGTNAMRKGDRRGKVGVKEMFAEAKEAMDKLGRMDSKVAFDLAISNSDVAAKLRSAENRRGRSGDAAMSATLSDNTSPVSSNPTTTALHALALTTAQALTEDLATSVDELRSTNGPNGLATLKRAAVRKFRANLEAAEKKLREGFSAAQLGSAAGLQPSPLSEAPPSSPSDKPKSEPSQPSPPSQSSPDDAVKKARIPHSSNLALQSVVKDLRSKLQEEIGLRRAAEKQLKEMGER